MNLKQAAQRLDVHYQTAYRWVRDGELVAVKVGNRYEVSESAIDLFVHRRASLVSSHVAQPSRPTPATADPDDAIAELRVLARETRATAQPCFDAATILVGTRSGDAAVLRLVDESGDQLQAVSSFAAAPEARASVVGAIAAAGSFPRSTAFWSAAEQSGEVHIVHHMPQDLMRDLFGDEGRFAGRGVKVIAAAAAPMFVEGEFAGGLLAVKTQSHLPFSDAEVSLLREVAALCAQALHKVGAFRRTWQSNTRLNEQLTAWLATGSNVNEVGSAGRQLLDTGRPQALLTADASVVASTASFDAMTATTRPGPGGIAGRWQSARLHDVIDGVASQVEIDPLKIGDPGAIVSAVRRPDAELQLLVLDVISF